MKPVLKSSIAFLLFFALVSIVLATRVQVIPPSDYVSHECENSSMIELPENYNASVNGTQVRQIDCSRQSAYNYTINHDKVDLDAELPSENGENSSQNHIYLLGTGVLLVAILIFRRFDIRGRLK